jgi:cobyrinic acid a,c-diamide synthase
MSQIFISAAHKSSGKTTISIGLCAALAQRGLQVQAFKKGPDYIDPIWLGMASGSPCYNLDFHVMQQDEITTLHADKAAGKDAVIIEGNKGLYDGLDLDGSNSNAALAMLLGVPVVLVLDVRGMTRGVAPLLLGYQAFEKDINICGVIMNRVGGSRHESKLRRIIEHYTDISVLGAVHNDTDMTIIERHLGLVPANEQDNTRHIINLMRDRVASQVDLDHLLSLGSPVPDKPVQPAPVDAAQEVASLRIGIIRDAAFGFYYPHDLEIMQQHGAELVFIDSLTDASLPAIDGLFIGGGFPETHLGALQQNMTLRRQIKQAIDNGLPVYAECGGLMYLSRSIQWKGQRYEMVNSIPADVMMHSKPQGRGYTVLEETSRHPWHSHLKDDAEPATFNAHEFHYSSISEPDAGFEYTYAFRVLRGHGIDGNNDGIVYKNVLACYIHQQHNRQNPWVHRFIQFIAANKTNTGTTS